jgi:subtilisin family serine protease
MSVASFQETIETAGYAKVIVALKPPVQVAATATSVTALAAAARGNSFTRSAAASHARSVEQALGNHFIVPNQVEVPRTAAVALAAGSRLSLRSTRRVSVRAAPQTPRVRVFPRLGLALGYVNMSGAVALEADERVQAVHKAPVLSLIRPTNIKLVTPKRAVTWGITRLGVERLWDAGYTGKGVIVGHLDTGVDGSHPALQGAIHAFAEFDMAGNMVPNARAHDSDEHGTHTAGTIAGRPGPRGTFGVAPGAELACGLVIEGGQVVDRILSGMEWLIEQKCRILSMSLGLRDFTPAFEVVINGLRAAGILPVIAVGNEGPDTSRSPGNYANVLSVGALDHGDIVADFSSSQKFNRAEDPLVPDLVAPGVGVLSCIPGGRFAEMDGSSMATPHMAGLAALLFEAKPNATIEEVERAILASCQRPAGMIADRGNRGVPDAVRAFEILTETQLPAVAAAAVPRRLRRAKVVRRAPAGQRRAAAARPKKKRVAGGKKRRQARR